MKTILSLFDYSGTWSAPYAAAGHNVVQLDIKHDPELADVRKFSVEYLMDTLGLDMVDGILAAPPCTDFAGSGAQYWGTKDADGTTAASVEMVRQVIRCVEYFKPDFWIIENPIGRLPKLVQGLGKPLVIHPWQLAGHVDADLSLEEKLRLETMLQINPKDLTESDLELVKASSRYTKRTCFWGRFNAPTLDPRTAIRCSEQGSWLQLLGGKTAKTKEQRSDTPTAFAAALYAANRWTPDQAAAWKAERAAEWCLGMLEGNLAADPAEIAAVLDPDEHPDVTAEEVTTAWNRLFSKPRSAALAPISL